MRVRKMLNIQLIYVTAYSSEKGTRSAMNSYHAIVGMLFYPYVTSDRSFMEKSENNCLPSCLLFKASKISLRV